MDMEVIATPGHSRSGKTLLRSPKDGGVAILATGFGLFVLLVGSQQ